MLDDTDRRILRHMLAEPGLGTADLADRAAARGREGCWGKGALGPCRELAAGRAARDALAGGAVLAFAGGGVLAGVTVSSFWWAPAAGSRLVGATLRGRW